MAYYLSSDGGLRNVENSKGFLKEIYHIPSVKRISYQIFSGSQEDEQKQGKPDFGKSNPEELQKQRHNLKQILLSTNATPIRRHTDMGYACALCDNYFPKPADLKKHTLGNHDGNTIASIMDKTCLSRFLVKLDVTHLECSLCNDVINSFSEVIDHLKGHGNEMHSDINNYIIPFKFEDDLLKCTLCSEVHRKFKSMQLHMYEHYRNFVCDVCNAGFINQRMVCTHYFNSHKKGCFPCSHCAKTFDTIRKKIYHEQHAHDRMKMHKCGYCTERFRSFDTKQRHQMSKHNIYCPTFDCSACSRNFSKPSELTVHIKKDHLMETRFQCTYCAKAYFFKFQLDNHMIRHTHVKDFKCEVCDKCFSRLKALREHVKIHADDRRFRCKYCDMAYVQKVSLRKHLQKKHDEVLDY